MKALKPSYARNTALNNLYNRQLIAIEKSIQTLNEDLQFDYQIELDEISN